jgi:hypothetical protein
METLASLLVGRPLHILLIALAFLVAHVLLRATGIGSTAHPRALLVVGGGWALYAAWEWLVLTRTPEANIRVDLMLIWPVLLLLSIWFTVRAMR